MDAVDMVSAGMSKWYIGLFHHHHHHDHHVVPHLDHEQATCATTTGTLWNVAISLLLQNEPGPGVIL